MTVEMIDPKLDILELPDDTLVIIDEVKGNSVVQKKHRDALREHLNEGMVERWAHEIPPDGDGLYSWLEDRDQASAEKAEQELGDIGVRAVRILVPAEVEG